MKPPVKFEWKGNHHSYYGVFLVAFGVFNYLMGVDNGQLSELGPLWISTIGLGAFCIIDDLIEHNVTSETPLRKIYLAIFKIKE